MASVDNLSPLEVTVSASIQTLPTLPLTASAPEVAPAPLVIPRQRARTDELAVLQPTYSPRPPRFLPHVVGLSTLIAGEVALILAWTGVGGDLSVLVAILGLVLAALTLLHVRFGLATNPATAIVGGLVCLAVLVAPVLLAPAGTGTTRSADVGQLERSVCLAQARTTEEVNACT